LQENNNPENDFSPYRSKEKMNAADQLTTLAEEAFRSHQKSPARRTSTNLARSLFSNTAGKRMTTDETVVMTPPTIEIKVVDMGVKQSAVTTPDERFNKRRNRFFNKMQDEYEVKFFQRVQKRLKDVSKAD
jgi:hypothetical protein